MTYLVYTDAACRPQGDMKTGKIASSFFIKLEEKFIAQQANNHTEDGNIFIAESLAVGVAVEYLLKEKHITSDDRVVLHTDSLAVIDFFKNVKHATEMPTIYDKRLEQVWRTLKELTDTCTWYFQKVRSHKTDVVDGNKVADRLAKYALYYGNSQ